MKKNKTKVLIADDHKLFRKGVIEIINSGETAEVIAEAENGEELLLRCAELQPDIIIVDISMPVMSGVEAVKKLSRLNPSIKALFLSMYDADEYIYAVIMSGGLGLINKNIDKNELFAAIEKVSKGEKHFKNLNEEQVQDIINRFANSRAIVAGNLEDLTNREKKILKYIAEGLTSIEISKKLNLSKRTVDSHRTNLIHKLNLKSLPELMKFSIQYSELQK